MRHRPAFVLLGCAALAASQVYACGIELDTAPGGSDAGNTSGATSGFPSSTGGPSSGSSSSSSTSSGVVTASSSSSSSSSSGTVIPDDGGDEPDAPPGCTTVSLVGLDFPCSKLAEVLGSQTVTVQGHTVTCYREGQAGLTNDILTPDVTDQTGGAWVRLLDGATAQQFDLDVAVEITGSATLGAGFALSFVNADGDPAVPPTAGTSTYGLGIPGYRGVATTVQTDAFAKLGLSTIPGSPAFATSGSETGVGTYRLTVHHDAGAVTATASLARENSAAAPLMEAPVDVPLNGVLTNEIDWIGITAATGNPNRQQHRIVSFDLTYCQPQ